MQTEDEMEKVKICYQVVAKESEVDTTDKVTEICHLRGV